MKIVVKTEWITLAEAIKLLKADYGLKRSRATLYNHVMSGKLRGKPKRRGTSLRAAWTVFVPSVRAYAEDVLKGRQHYGKKYQ